MLRSSVGRRGNYGVDTPMVPAVQAFLALVMLQLGFRQVTTFEDAQGWWLLGAGTILLGIALTYLHASRRGKFIAWSRMLGEFDLRGDEHILDLGCGRGAVTTLAAARVPRGRVLGIDAWREHNRLMSNRQGTELQIARRNAQLDGVTDRVDYQQGDIAELPFDGNRYDLVVSGLGVSALAGADRRQAAVDEALRVTKPGGRLALADIRHTRAYADRLTELGCEDVETRSMGWEVWYGGPWTPTVLVTARKPTL